MVTKGYRQRVQASFCFARPWLLWPRTFYLIYFDFGFAVLLAYR